MRRQDRRSGYEPDPLPRWWGHFRAPRGSIQRRERDAQTSLLIDAALSSIYLSSLSETLSRGTVLMRMIRGGAA